MCCVKCIVSPCVHYWSLPFVYSVVLYGCKTWSLTFREERMLRVFRIGCWGEYLGRGEGTVDRVPPDGNPIAVNKYRIVFLIYFPKRRSFIYRNSSIIGEHIEKWALNKASRRDVCVPTDITRLFDVTRIRRMWCEDNDVLGPAAIMKNHYGISRQLLEGVMTNFNQESQNRSWGSRLRNSSRHNNAVLYSFRIRGK